MSARNHVIVIGAGVLGLSCALRLKLAGYKISIVARDLPGELSIDYASPWAGAHFRAVPTTNRIEQLERELAEETYKYYMDLAQKEPSAAVTRCPAYEYFEQPAQAYTDLEPEKNYCTWPGFEVLDKSALPLSATWGTRYDAWVLDSPRFLAWLHERLGDETTTIQKNIKNPLDAIEVICGEAGVKDSSILAVVNASGTGMDDPASFVSRGQFLHISNVYPRTVSYHCADGSSMVVVPRFGEGGTLIGGSKEPRVLNEQPDPDTTAWIKKRVLELCPDLATESGLKVLRVNVGRRPMRQGGLRLEIEESGPNHQSEKLTPPIIHCYGAGGSGFKIGWGAAGRILGMVQSLAKP